MTEHWPIEFLPPRKPDVAKYLSRMGLTDLLHVAGCGRPLPTVRRWPPEQRFVELQRFDADHPADEVGDLIHARLGSWNDNYLQTTLYDALFELGLNIEEHAQRPGFVAAQCYQNKRVGIAVGDFGVGIHGSLEAAGQTFDRPGDAIIAAVTTRLTSKDRDGGFGLQSVLDMFVRHNGWAVVVTGGEAVTFNSHTEQRISMVGFPNPGTFVFGELRWR